MKIAYLMSRFPKITETFILYEILALKQQGIAVEVFPLQREHTKVMHPDVEQLLSQVHFLPFISISIIYANLIFLVKNFSNYISTLFEVLKDTRGCSNFFLGALAFFPKAVKIAHECEKSGVTHIHAHFANHPTLVAYVIYRLTGIGYSFTAHGSDLHKRQQMLAKKYLNSRFAVMISQYNKNFFKNETKITALDKMPVIHCGIDLDYFGKNTVEGKTTQVKRRNLPINLLCIASFREVKGHRYLLEACQLLKLKGICFILHLVGDGPLKQAIKTQIQVLALADHVLMHGALPRDRISDILTTADIFVLTSFQTKSGNREGIPVVIMEAMAAKIAVVASDVSGIPELVENNVTGFLSEPENPQSIADKLELLIVDPVRRIQMGQAGHVKVQNEFDLSKNVAKLCALFKKY